MSERLAPVNALRARRVYLHVGLPKTGTTYLQDRMWRNRDAALHQGLLPVTFECTARDLARQIPSVWQENIKNLYTTTCTEFVNSIRDRDQPHDPFWEFQDLPRILQTWGRGLPPDRVHVVTMPSPADSPHLLWRRFNSVLGIDGDRLTRDLPAANGTLDAVQLEMMRRLNARVRDNISWARYESVVKEYLAGRILIVAPRRRTAMLPVQEFGWVSKVAAGFVADIRAAGYHVVGDLADLEPRPSSAEPQPEPHDHELLDVALDALTEIVRTLPEPPTDGAAGR